MPVFLTELWVSYKHGFHRESSLLPGHLSRLSVGALRYFASVLSVCLFNRIETGR